MFRLWATPGPHGCSRAHLTSKITQKWYPRTPKIIVSSILVSQMQNNQVKKDVDVTNVIRTTDLQFTGHLSHRGRRQRASPLSIRRTPAGVAGRDENSFGFCINASFREPASAAGPSKLEPKMHHFSNLNFSTLFSSEICKICEK